MAQYHSAGPLEPPPSLKNLFSHSNSSTPPDILLHSRRRNAAIRRRHCRRSRQSELHFHHHELRLRNHVDNLQQQPVLLDSLRRQNAPRAAEVQRRPVLESNQGSNFRRQQQQQQQPINTKRPAFRSPPGQRRHRQRVPRSAEEQEQ